MTTKNILLTEAYLKAYQKLNVAQKKAVETLQGPVAVFAGPGTGKTQLIATRIAKILASPETQASPGNILCLTFTEAGAIAMRERLVGMIGSEAHRVHIFTFHGFCNQVIARNPDYFGMNDIKPISDVEKIELFQKLISEQIKPGQMLFPMGQETKQLAKGLEFFFDLIKKEDFQPSSIEKSALEEIESNKYDEDFYYKRNGKDFKKGDFNEKKFKEAEKRLLKCVEASRLFEPYNALMKSESRFDYHDMIAWVIQAFKLHEPLLLRYKEQYLYFLVDEYQDSNGSQLHLLNLLTEDLDNQPNLFVVGDADQAIYRFQGAEADNLTKFENRYADHLTKVVLTENYRSVPAVLQVSQHLLTPLLPERKEALIASNPIYQQGIEKVCVKQWPNRSQQTAGAVELIKLWLSEGVSSDSIAIIYRNHRQADPLIQLLQQEKIPFSASKPVNTLTLPLVKQLLQFLKWVLEEYKSVGNGSYLLYEMLHYEYLNIIPGDAMKVAIYCGHKKENELNKNWFQVLCDEHELKNAGISNINSFDKIKNLLNALIKSYSNDTLQGLVSVAITESGMLGWIMQSPERNWHLEVLHTFFDFVKEETSRRPNTALNDLIQLIDKMLVYQVGLTATKVFSSDNGIQLMSAHGSKGLEFEKVIILGAEKSEWEKKRSPGNFISLPKALQTIEEESKENDERRLFYVAMTRAKRGLIISTALSDDNEKPLESSVFVSDCLEISEFTSVENAHIPSDILAHLQIQSLLPISLSPIQWIDKSVLKEVLKNYRLSVTHLNKYLSCPVSFYFENVLKIPQPRNAASGFGSAIHGALERYYKDMQLAENSAFGPLSELLNFYEKEMLYYKSHFTAEQFNRYLERGKHALQNFREQIILPSQKTVLLEYKSDHLNIDQVPVSGMLDKLEFKGNDVTVVDYKTGKLKKERLSSPNEKHPLGGDYWRQMVFYKLLIDSDKSKPWKMVAGRFDFVEPNEKNTFDSEVILMEKEDENIVRTQIKETYQKIMNLEFEEGCGEEHCIWCNFMKSHFSSTAQLGMEEEI